MPELLEVESYRRLADQTIGRTIAEVDAHDTWFLKGVSAQQVIEGLTGARIRATDRRGKLLTVDLGPERPVLGLRFGMTGRLLLDGHPETERLIYAPGRDDPRNGIVSPWCSPTVPGSGSPTPDVSVEWNSTQICRGWDPKPR